MAYDRRVNLSRSWAEFEQRVKHIIGDILPELREEQLMRMGEIFKSEIKETITRLNIVDTGRLRDSWQVKKTTPYTVTVGSNVEYAKMVNDGHRQTRRFVPGRWQSNGTFQYIPYPHNNGQGMMLTARFVEGKKFVEKARRTALPKIREDVEHFMRTVLNEVFGE
jgi:hypothetical protein